MAECVNTLKDWTGLSNVTILFDSTVDEFTEQGLFHKLKGKPNIAIVAFTTDGDVFGGFYTVVATQWGKKNKDPNLFVFSFESHGRCETPQRFVVKDELKKKAFVRFYKSDSRGFVDFGVSGVGGFTLGNEMIDSYCWKMSCAFEGLENTTLNGKNYHYPDGPYHHCARLVAVRLE